jgi:hypothetical protein
VVAPVCTTLHHNSIPRLEDAGNQCACERPVPRSAGQGRVSGLDGSLRPARTLGLIVVHQQHASSQQSLVMVLADDLVPHREDVAVIGR